MLKKMLKMLESCRNASDYKTVALNCFTAALLLLYHCILLFFLIFLADGLDCFAVAEKWGYRNISLLLKAYVEKARITELANDAGTCFTPVVKQQ